MASSSIPSRLSRFLHRQNHPRTRFFSQLIGNSSKAEKEMTAVICSQEGADKPSFVFDSSTVANLDFDSVHRANPSERILKNRGVPQVYRKVRHWHHNYRMLRPYSTQPTAEEEELPMESELRRKVGWFLKILAAITITYVGFNAYPIMGDSLIWQSVALVRLDDPFMKRSGASRISMIATNDKRRKNFVEAGGVEELAKMLQSASDDKTRREAVKALASLCECEVAVEALHVTGVEHLLKSLAKDSSDSDVEGKSKFLLEKLEQWKQGVK